MLETSSRGFLARETLEATKRPAGRMKKTSVCLEFKVEVTLLLSVRQKSRRYATT